VEVYLMALTIDSTLTLNNGIEMPRFGLGTYKDSDEAAASSVEFALRHGYRLVDTASLYENEAGVGRGLAASGVPRSEVFVTSKVWNEEQGFEGTTTAIDLTLERLQTTYVDLYLVHWPIRRHLEGTWRALEQALADGKTRAIGVSNFLEPQLDALFRIAEVPPAVDQIEYHPHLQQPALVDLLVGNRVVLQAWAPLMRGRVNLEPTLVRIAHEHDRTPAQIAVRWILQSGYATIPKSTHEARIVENADVFDFELTSDEMTEIDALDSGERMGKDPGTYVWDD